MMTKKNAEAQHFQYVNNEQFFKVKNSNSEVTLESKAWEEDNSYDPHKHRNRPNPTTNFETLIHLLKGSLGTGILAMPNAFRNSGLVTGGIATFIIGAICVYCIHILVKAQYVLCRRLKIPILSYPMSMKRALEQGPSCLKRFADSSPVIVDVFMIVYHLGICCVYVLFAARNIKQVTDVYFEPLDVRIHMLILLIPLTLLNYIRNLKVLAPFSTVANLITFVGLSLILVYVFDGLPPISSVRMTGSAKNFALYFGTTLFALEAVGVILSLENNMKTPASFGGYTGVLNIAMTIILSLYFGIGFLGYLKYGDKTDGSITLNLPNDAIMAQCIKIMFAVAILITYALQAYVPVDIIWNTYIKRKVKSRKLLWEYVCRTLVTIVTFLLAISVPKLDLFISLFGALCLSALGIVFPAIIEVCVKWPHNLGPYKFHLFKAILLILFGVIGLIVGTFVSMKDIIESFNTDGDK